MWLIGLCVLMHGIFQIGYSSWIGPYDAARMGITPAKAALFISVNNVVFFAGRALLGWLCVSISIADLVLLGIASGLGSLTIFFGLLVRDYHLALALCFLEGFFVAGDSPAMSSFVGGRFPQQVSVAFAIYTGIGQAGAAAGGYMVGFLARLWNNIQQPIWIVPITSLLLSLLAFTWHGVIKRSSRPIAATTS
jgi:MFS family permease